MLSLPPAVENEALPFEIILKCRNKCIEIQQVMIVQGVKSALSCTENKILSKTSDSVGFSLFSSYLALTSFPALTGRLLSIS